MATLSPGDTNAVRLALAPRTTARTMLDGAWWPRSRDAEAELSTLFEALATRQIRAYRAMLNPAEWPDHPRRVTVGELAVRIGWFATLERSLLIVSSYPRGRHDLLVIAPPTPAEVADRAMSLAVDGSSTATATHVLAAANNADSAVNDGGRRNGRPLVRR